MLSYVARIFSKLVNRLRGREHENDNEQVNGANNNRRDALYPLRAATRKDADVLQNTRSKLRKVEKAPPQPPTLRGLKSSEKFLAEARKALHKVNPNLPKSASLHAAPLPPSPPSKDLPETLHSKGNANESMQKQESASEEPEWYKFASASAMSLYQSPSYDLGEKLSEFVKEQSAALNFDTLFSPESPKQLSLEESGLETPQKRNLSVWGNETPHFRQQRNLSADWAATPDKKSQRNLSTATPDMRSQRNLSTAWAIETHRQERNLSTAWAIETHRQERNLSTAWAMRSHTPTRTLSRSMARSIARSVASRSQGASISHREAALSCSIALASFHYALRRSTCLTPTAHVQDDEFARKLSEFGRINTEIVESQVAVIEKMKPDLQGFEYVL